jgi:hypothetical protein
MHADVRDYQPEAASFQLVLVAYLQLHEPELDGVLRRAVTALAPGGTLLVVGPRYPGLTRASDRPVMAHRAAAQSWWLAVRC